MQRLPLLALLVLTLAACDAGPAVPEYDFAAPLPETSLYLVDAAWTDDDGATTALDAFRGTPVVLTMGYTSCGYACPLLVQDMKKIASHLPEGTPARYVLVSMDPETDTPARLRTFREAHGLGDDWALLTGRAEDVRTLAALLGVRYRPEAGGAIAHSNVITVLDRDGVVAVQLEGLGTDPGPAVAAVQQALGLNP